MHGGIALKIRFLTCLSNAQIPQMKKRRSKTPLNEVKDFTHENSIGS